MALCFVVARGGGVIPVGAQSVRPAVVHIAAVDGDVDRYGWWRHRRDKGGVGNRRERGSEAGLVRAVISRIAGGEFSNAFLIAEFELGFENVEGPFVNGAETEFFCGGGEQASCFEHRKS